MKRVWLIFFLTVVVWRMSCLNIAVWCVYTSSVFCILQMCRAPFCDNHLEDRKKPHVVRLVLNLQFLMMGVDQEFLLLWLFFICFFCCVLVKISALMLTWLDITFVQSTKCTNTKTGKHLKLSLSREGFLYFLRSLF